MSELFAGPRPDFIQMAQPVGGIQVNPVGARPFQLILAIAARE